MTTPNSKLSNSEPHKRIVYQEFGNTQPSAAFERAVPDRPPAQQNLKVYATRRGRKGKTVTIISGFESNSQTLDTLLKQLKIQCGTGGTVKKQTLEIQGDHTQKLVQLLNQLGYKAKISGG